MKEIGQDYKTCTYAKKDIHDKTVPVKKRAEATKEYLEKYSGGKRRQERKRKVTEKQDWHKG